jgi:hypothetical protein
MLSQRLSGWPKNGFSDFLVFFFSFIFIRFNSERFDFWREFQIGEPRPEQLIGRLLL